MKKINKTRYAILGMLLDLSRSGYEIKEIMKDSTAHFWQESDASLYPMLKLLAKEKKVKSQTAFVGKRKKEIFTITNKGREEFSKWFQRPIENETRRSEFLLKLFFTTKETEKEMHKHFQRSLRQLQETIEEYRQIEGELEALNAAEFPRKPFWLKTLRYGIAHVELEISWIEEQLEECKK